MQIQIQISIRVKSCIRIRIGTKVKIQKLKRLEIELWRAVDAHNGCLKAQNEALEGLETSGRRF
jgi:hypothetical protein